MKDSTYCFYLFLFATLSHSVTGVIWCYWSKKYQHFTIPENFYDGIPTIRGDFTPSSTLEALGLIRQLTYEERFCPEDFFIDPELGTYDEARAEKKCDKYCAKMYGFLVTLKTKQSDAVQVSDGILVRKEGTGELKCICELSSDATELLNSRNVDINTYDDKIRESWQKAEKYLKSKKIELVTYEEIRRRVYKDLKAHRVPTNADEALQRNWKQGGTSWYGWGVPDGTRESMRMISTAGDKHSDKNSDEHSERNSGGK